MKTKTKAKEIEDCATLFEIELPKESIAEAFDEVYDEMTRVASIPGFRVGKAPKELVKKQYAKSAREEVLKRLIPKAYRDALEEHKVNPIGLPEISEVRFEEEVLSFKARVDTRPKFRLKGYKGLKLERKSPAVTDEDVAKTLENLREASAKYVPVEERPVAMGDYVIGDLECLVDGKPVHKKREKIWMHVDSQSLIPELSEKMVGMKRDEERSIEARLPDKYPDKNLAGKGATYRVKAGEIKARVLPAVDDDFAKTLGRTSLEDLKVEVRTELGARARLNADMEAENKLLACLMDENVFLVPSSLVARQLKYMIEDAKARLVEKGFRREELDKKDGEFKEKYKSEAVRRVRLLFILDEIAAAENIKVSADDTEKAYKAISAQAGKPLEEVKAYYEKEGLLESLNDKIKEEKVIEFLIKNADITEK